MITFKARFTFCLVFISLATSLSQSWFLHVESFVEPDTRRHYLSRPAWIAAPSIRGNPCLYSKYGNTIVKTNADFDPHWDPLWVTGRRESIAQISMAAMLVGFPWDARASSTTQSQAGTQSSNSASNKSTPKDRSMDPELSAAVQQLFDLDASNRLVPGKDYVIDVQGAFRKSSGGNGTDGANDAAPGPLFRYVDPAVFRDRPTYQLFLALLDNYQSNVCSPEDDTKAEQEEAQAFLRACMATPAMQFCYRYCRSRLAAEAAAAEVAGGDGTANTPAAKKVSFDTEEDFLRLLYKIWFRMYSRSKECDEDHNKINGSSGFEHVFVGETRNGKVIGFHNWIQIYSQEKLGNVDYRGSIAKGKTTSSNTNSSRILTYNLRWNGAEKYVGTSFIGVSPEFELALYTMVFLVGKKDNIVRLNLSQSSAEQSEIADLDVKCFKTKGKVGSSYVESIATL